MTDLFITDHTGQFHVFLDPGGDHIVTKLNVDKHGFQRDQVLAPDTDAFDRAVARAQCAAAFPKTP